ncbi:MAG: hypothetical protein R3D51_12230 [Hyphomicrobiaceae bacterium]
MFWTFQRRRLPVAAVVAVMLGLVLASHQPARAMSTADFLASLTGEETAELQAWKAARRAHEHHLDVYWDKVEDKRQARKKKRSRTVLFTADDYVMTLPPSYTGPKLSNALAAKYSKFLTSQEEAAPSPSSSLPVVSDYLGAAKRVYGFVPERVSEKEFKRRYAEEAHALGLEKNQVVRVYALETGGIGTYDMQAGIHPTKKTGRAISSALGYAQLLDANSVNELSKNGKLFIAHLQRKAANPNISSQRRHELNYKITVLKRMYANAKRVPYNWARHQRYAKTEEGMGMHVLNIDGDIGPMLQAMKLKGLLDMGAKYGRTNMTGAQVEVMNLSGPATGLELMQPAGLKAPVSNFFSRRAYYVNKMVIGLTGEQLLAELDRRMTASMKAQGSIEFAQAFDEVLAARTAGR